MRYVIAVIVFLCLVPFVLWFTRWLLRSEIRRCLTYFVMVLLCGAGAFDGGQWIDWVALPITVFGLWWSVWEWEVE